MSNWRRRKVKKNRINSSCKEREKERELNILYKSIVIQRNIAKRLLVKFVIIV